MQCPKCHHENEPETRFCEQCGTPMDQEDTKEKRSVNPVLIGVIGTVIVVLIALVVVLFVIPALSGNDHEDAPISEPSAFVTTTTSSATSRTTRTTKTTVATTSATTAVTTAPTANHTAVSLSEQDRFDINIFLSNFSEQSFNEYEPITYADCREAFSVSTASAADYVRFSYMFRYINYYSELHDTSFTEHNIPYVYLTLDQINEDAQRFFGCTVSMADIAAEYAGTDVLVKEDRVCFMMASGATHSSFTVVDELSQRADGLYEARFTIYYYPAMGGGDRITDVSVYYMTPQQAANDPDVAVQTHGTAVLSKVDGGRSPYHLLEYRLDGQNG